MPSDRQLWAVDCETDPAKYGRIPKPFLWGAYNGTRFLLFRSTDDFVKWAREQRAILYAHNGGKFDFMFLLLFVGATKAQVINGRIVKMHLGKAELRDSYSIVPEALSMFGKSEIDYRKLEANVRAANDNEIVEYLRIDCVSLYDLVSEFRQVAGKKITIAANALAYSKRLGVNPGKTNHTYDKNLRKFYYGGRCQVFQPGAHKNVRVIDIHSAYPFAMCHDHASGEEFHHISPETFLDLPRDQQQRAFITVECHSRGAFPRRTNTDLEFPTDRDTFYVTGWEYVCAMDLGLISDVIIHDVIVHDRVINFTPYVMHWYDLKANTDKKTDPIHYHIYKRLMNSLYGKLAQDPGRYYDYRIVPGGTFVCFDYVGPYDGTCANCNDAHINHGWEIYTEYEGVEIQRRTAMHKLEHKYGKAWEGQPIYNNVATGASITGFTRAHLLRAIHAVGIKKVIYCDTDSIICDAKASLSKLSLTENLGDWADEGIATVGLFSGKKIYALSLSEMCDKFKGQIYEPCANCHREMSDHGGHPKVKVASKGSKLYYRDIEWIALGKLTDPKRHLIKDGERIIVWRSDFPSFSIAGEADFVVRNIRQTARAN